MGTARFVCLWFRVRDRLNQTFGRQDAGRRRALQHATPHKAIMNSRAVFMMSAHPRPILSRGNIGSLFLNSSGVLLWFTGVAKLLTILAGAPVLGSNDPLLGLKFSVLFVVAGSVEVLLGILLILPNLLNDSLKTILVAWVSTELMFYRLCLLYIGWHGPCPCLGSLTETLRVRPEVVDWLLIAALTYMLVGSWWMLLSTGLNTDSSKQTVNDS